MAVSFELKLVMATPVNINHPWIHLDGLLHHLRLLKRLGRDYYLLPTKQVTGFDWKGHRYEHVIVYRQELPFASVSFFEPPDVRSLQYYKRLEVAGFPGKRRVDIGSGHYRNWMLRAVYVPCHTVTFYGRGNLSLVSELLEDLTHLGNDTRIGWGKVATWQLQEIEEDRSIVWQGKAMRPIPVRLLKSYSEAVPLAWRAPYWAADTVELCAPPGAEVELR